MNSADSLQWSSVFLEGGDALSFAQGQFSQNIDEETRATLLLQPSGEVLSAGWIHGVAEEIEYVIPSPLVESTVQRIQRFLLRVDVSLRVNDSHSGPFATVAELFDSEWPGVEELRRNLPPHSFGASFVAASVSFAKGCFTGQELVGRADARGATMPWRFATGRCRDLDSLTADIQRSGPEGPQGVTSWCDGPHGVQWRAIVHRTWEPTEPSVELHFRA